MGKAIRIGIIGDFEPAYHSHFATNAALYDAATKLKVPLELRWLPTPSLDVPDAKKILGRWDGLTPPPAVRTRASTECCAGSNLREREIGHSWELEGASNILC
jgi:CTP synthase (UTP-ammonia lyase)